MESNNEATASFIDQIDDLIVQIYDREQKVEKVKQEGENGDILQGENGKRIKKLLSMKADKIDLETIYQIKSNKKDTEGLLGTQVTMNNYFKHILTLFIEIVDVQVAMKPNESKLGQEKRAGEIVQQVKALANQVMKYDPASECNKDVVENAE